MRTAIYPGSFDPPTNGHLDLIERARAVFDRVVVAVLRNPRKEPMFTVEERVEMLREVTSGDPGVDVEGFDGLLVDMARTHRAQAIIRGLRAVSDFEFEFQMALMNRRLDDNVETLFMVPHQAYTYLSSSLIKEVAGLGGAVDELVPPEVLTRLQERFKR
ncbi:MAG: pantetheine-phosphate adenylyltransferase [Acidobacteria bacterium]|nr:pantetheine-phosphate adenylyltransferase [Acidobacteriota bacterium]